MPLRKSRHYTLLNLGQVDLFSSCRGLGRPGINGSPKELHRETELAHGFAVELAKVSGFQGRVGGNECRSDYTGRTGYGDDGDVDHAVGD